MIALEAVLPMIASHMDHFRILSRSLDKFFPGLSTCHVIVPDTQFDSVSDEIQGPRFKVASETQVVPELGVFRNMPGWYKQQLIKLAMHEFVGSDFYLTLDADVICVKPTRPEDLFVGGKALSRRTGKDYHPEWYAWAERVLNVRRSGLTHGVTPALFSARGMEELAAHLGKRALTAKNRIRHCYESAKQRRFTKPNWKTYLIMSTPWTEYSLYNTFLEHAGLFDKYHVDGGEYSIYHNSVWNKDQFSDWDPETAFNGEGNYFFSVIQSNAKIDMDAIRNKLDSYLR